MKRRISKPPTKPETPSTAAPVPDRPADSEEAALFRAAMQDVAPLAASGRVAHPHQKPRPIPQKITHEEKQPAADTLSDHVPLQLEAGDEWSFLRPGVARQTLKQLRRGYWGIQAQLDLHGLTREAARQELADFLDASSRHGLRCVRVIHGKGLSSKNREPVLKTRVGSWLMQRAEVLAFCQAAPADGGSGAVLVLLRTAVPENAA